MPDDAPAPPIRSILLPEHGYAFLRSHRDDKYWHNPDARMAFLTYDRAGVHANADKLSLMLFDNDRMLLSDVEGRATVPHAFSSKIQGELNRGALSQNTVMIDGQNQRLSPKMLRLIESRDLPAEKRVTAVDDAGILYDGVRQMRTVAMTDDYVLDVFQVDCGETSRQIDWVMHILNENATPLDATAAALKSADPFELPAVGAWPWLRHAKSYQPDGPIQLGWHDGASSVRLHVLSPGVERVILCGYPATDEPDSASIPMIIVRQHAARATFAAIWLTRSNVNQVNLRALPRHDNNLVYEVTAKHQTRQHKIPMLESFR